MGELGGHLVRVPLLARIQTGQRLSCQPVATFELDHVTDVGSGIMLVSLAGELDLTNVDDLEDELESVTDGGPVVLDLNRLVFVDSAALHRFFRIVRGRGAGGVAFVIEPTAPVAGALAIVELGRAAPVAPTRDEALAALGRARSR
jgi:anti-anti-sigma factor